ncbi:MAG TPA: methyltetrahydrofolate cobalamin methyltransferase [Candidatus Limnocylindrales bacterium]|nr:methyltetrahydrofolate cobalamin methyltransferase [Candidatus Limnocylindrales bacterium]
MIIIGELINSTRKGIKKAIVEQDAVYIQDLAVRQVENGADYVDVNAGAFVFDEAKHLIWLVETVQAVVNKPLALDSPDPEALEAAMKVHQGTPMINSISAEKERYNRVIPLVKESGASVVALCMGDEGGMPDTAEERFEVAKRLLHDLDRDGIPLTSVFLDPLLKPVSVNGEYGPQALDVIGKIKALGSGAHITCGLSNISFGLPRRALLNQAFLILAMGRGMDSAIADPLDKAKMRLIRAAEVVLNLDSNARGYLTAFRSGKLG